MLLGNVFVDACVAVVERVVARKVCLVVCSCARSCLCGKQRILKCTGGSANGNKVVGEGRCAEGLIQLSACFIAKATYELSAHAGTEGREITAAEGRRRYGDRNRTRLGSASAFVVNEKESLIFGVIDMRDK